jgi:RHS repeat-associated protein
MGRESIRLSNQVTQTVDYKYDAYNQLVYRVLDGDGALGSAAIEQTVFVYDGGQVVLQFDKSGAGSLEDVDLTHRYLWGPGTDMLLADEQVADLGYAGEVFWAAADHLGSVRDVVDSSGTLRIRRQFDSYGNIVGETHYDEEGEEVESHEAGFVTVAFAFTGRYFDPATSLQNNLNRWFDAVVGSWISEDPIGFAGDPSNVFRYVVNAPTMYDSSD